MRRKGSITGWQDERGFGFIEPEAGGRRVFAHIRSFPRGGRRPEDGDAVTYEVVPGTKGRVQAGRIAFAGTGRRRQRRTGRRSYPVALILLAGVAVAIAIAAAVFSGVVPVTVPAIYIGMSLVTFLAYAWDKWAAMNGRWRTPEDTLLMLCLFGGWPGGLLASRTLRHKSRKRSYRLKFALAVLLNLVVLGWGYPEAFEKVLLFSG